MAINQNNRWQGFSTTDELLDNNWQSLVIRKKDLFETLFRVSHKVARPLNVQKVDSAIYRINIYPVYMY